MSSVPRTVIPYSGLASSFGTVGQTEMMQYGFFSLSLSWAGPDSYSFSGNTTGSSHERYGRWFRTGPRTGPELYDVLHATQIPGLLVDPDTRPSGLMTGLRLVTRPRRAHVMNANDVVQRGPEKKNRKLTYRELHRLRGR